MRPVNAAIIWLVLTSGFAQADEFGVIIKKVDGNKISATMMIKKDEKPKDVTLIAVSNVKVVKTKFNTETNKTEPGEAVEGGLKNELFTASENGVYATIVTNDDGKVAEVRVGFGKKKKKEEK